MRDPAHKKPNKRLKKHHALFSKSISGTKLLEGKGVPFLFLKSDVICL